MFQSLSDRLAGVLDKLTKRGSLSENDVNEAMREVRRALLEADVALDVVRSFTDKVRAKAVGQNVVRSITPGQMVVKIVHDELVAMLGSNADPISLAAQPPVAILMVGLQGSGKTTTTAKIAYRLATRDRKKVLMASLDTRRPAAQEQLRVLGEQTKVDTLAIIAGQQPLQIARRAMDAARLGDYDVVLLDTAGRILGMGDVVSLVEKAAQTIDAGKALAIAEKMRSGSFDFDDLSEQLAQVEKLGGMSSMMGMMPGIGKMKKQIDAAGGIDDRLIKRQRAIISSMTAKERRNPKLLDGKRKRRIAAGSGTRPEDINKLVKMHRDMADMMKMMRKNPGMMARMAGAMGMGGGMGMGPAPSAGDLKAMQNELATLDPKALESLPAEVRDTLKNLPGAAADAAKPAKGLPGLPGLGGGRLPGLGGLPGLPGGPRGFPFGGKPKK